MRTFHSLLTLHQDILSILLKFNDDNHGQLLTEQEIIEHQGNLHDLKRQLFATEDLVEKLKVTHDEHMISTLHNLDLSYHDVFWQVDEMFQLLRSTLVRHNNIQENKNLGLMYDTGLVLSHTREICDTHELWVWQMHENLVVFVGYVGLRIYDWHLNLLREIPLLEGLVVTKVFVHPVRDELLLYCPENAVFVRVKLLEDDETLSFLRFKQFDEWIENVYDWEDDQIYVYSKNGAFCVDFSAMCIASVDPSLHLSAKESNIIQNASYLNVLRRNARGWTYYLKDEHVLVHEGEAGRITSELPIEMGYDAFLLGRGFLVLEENRAVIIEDGKIKSVLLPRNSASRIVGGLVNTYHPRQWVLVQRDDSTEETYISEYELP
jgi:hypothetical protein